jgi:hypothetical protein
MYFNLKIVCFICFTTKYKSVIFFRFPEIDLEIYIKYNSFKISLRNAV